jgi:hypothetical protein
MSGQLELTFSHQGGPDAGGLPVVVDVVDANLEVTVKPRLVQLGSGWRQDVEPGTYLVRVRFPSGEETRQTCTVRDGDHILISVDVRSLAGRKSLERSVARRPLAGTNFASAWVRRWRGDASRRWQPIDFDATTVGRDDYAVRYRFAADRQPNVLQLGGPRTAWRFVSLPAAPVVDVTVSQRGENDLAVEVTTGSAEAEALLGYLRTGAVEGAEATAESLLQQKRRDPIAAVTGGYYLLRTANIDRLSEWGPNLSQWFPWLPDGAVINGWQHIHAGREHRGDPDRHFDAARRQLIQAVRRGVPVYTEGLRLLVDALQLLREDAEAEDVELDTALTFIEPFAMAADWSAATVTYSGADPAEPDPRRRYGIVKSTSVEVAQPRLIFPQIRQTPGTLRSLTPQQRAAALEKAARARKKRAEVKNRLKRGSAFSDVIKAGSTDDVIGKMRVSALLESLPGVGKVRARQIMERLGIAESRRVRGLGTNQRSALEREFGSDV